MKKQEKECELFKFETTIPEVTKNESGQLTGGFIDISTIVCNEGDVINYYQCQQNDSCNPKCPPQQVNINCPCPGHVDNLCSCAD